jgi:hypothetical protein
LRSRRSCAAAMSLGSREWRRRRASEGPAAAEHGRRFFAHAPGRLRPGEKGYLYVSHRRVRRTVTSGDTGRQVDTGRRQAEGRQPGLLAKDRRTNLHRRTAVGFLTHALRGLPLAKKGYFLVRHRQNSRSRAAGGAGAGARRRWGPVRTDVTGGFSPTPPTWATSREEALPVRPAPPLPASGRGPVSGPASGGSVAQACYSAHWGRGYVLETGPTGPTGLRPPSRL